MAEIPEDLKELHAAADKLCRKLVDKKPQSQILFWALEFLVTSERAGDAEAKYAALATERDGLKGELAEAKKRIHEVIESEDLVRYERGLARKELAEAQADLNAAREEIRLLWTALTNEVGAERVFALSEAVIAARLSAPKGDQDAK